MPHFTEYICVDRYKGKVDIINSLLYVFPLKTYSLSILSLKSKAGFRNEGFNDSLELSISVLR
jgi:hypothetical protein